MHVASNEVFVKLLIYVTALPALCYVIKFSLDTSPNRLTSPSNQPDQSYQSLGSTSAVIIERGVKTSVNCTLIIWKWTKIYLLFQHLFLCFYFQYVDVDTFTDQLFGIFHQTGKKGKEEHLVSQWKTPDPWPQVNTYMQHHQSLGITCMMAFESGIFNQCHCTGA